MARVPHRGSAPNPPARRGRSFLGRLVYWGAVLGVWALIVVVGAVAWFSRDLPDINQLTQPTRQPSITFLDRSGAVIGSRGGRYAAEISLDELPRYVPAAFVAVEDRRFYDHPGFDVIGIARSLVRNARCMCIAGGGSTITQQLARNLFLTPDQNMSRKIREIILAVQLERRFSKQQILTLYLNRNDFGGVQGIEAASQRYFNKPAAQLSIGEAALLVGMLKAPTRYSPVSNTQRAERRATLVLAEMAENGAITQEQRQEALRARVGVFRQGANVRGQYFIDWIMQSLGRTIGPVTEDVVVETTLDLPIQAAAERALSRGVTAANGQGVQQGALVSLDGGGRVRALVGGTDYLSQQFNRAVDARRQAGSAFKPFVYLTALESGATPDMPVVDEAVTINGWTPRNYNNRYAGAMTLQQAVNQSVNTVAAVLADRLGRSNVAATARRLGIRSDIQTQPSMALGAVEVSPLEMAQAYAPFSNGGRLALAYGVNRVRTRAGRVLYQHDAQNGSGQAVIGNPALDYLNQMLRSVVSSGTGTRARVSGFDVAGKTGTTSDYRDAWFVGYTGGFVTAVWVGRDDNTSMRRVTGGSAPASIWRDYMAAVLPRLEVRPIPSGPPAPAGMGYGSGDAIGDYLQRDWFGEDRPAPGRGDLYDEERDDIGDLAAPIPPEPPAEDPEAWEDGPPVFDDGPPPPPRRGGGYGPAYADGFRGPGKPIDF